MFPSRGYFRGIPCPAHTRGTCGRPHCQFRHDMKVFPERNVSSSQSAVAAPAQEEADAEEEEQQETPQDQDMRQGVSCLNKADLPECSRATLSTGTMSLPEPEEQQEEEKEHQEQQEPQQQQPEPHSSQSVPAGGEIPKPELLHQLMSEALKKVLAENPTLASTVDASAIRIGIDPIGQVSPEGNKAKKQFYPRPANTPSYNPTPIRELKKRKLSVDGPGSSSSLVYNPTPKVLTGEREAKGGEDGGVMGEFSSDSEEAEEKNDDFDLLEEVLAEHSKNNKVKVKKKRVKELGKLQYSLNNADKKTVDNKVMIADAKKLTDREVKRYEVTQQESVNKVITDGPYFLPPSPVFTSSSDGFEAFNSRASYREEREEKERTPPDRGSDQPTLHFEPTKADSEPPSEKNTEKKSLEPNKTDSQPLIEKKSPKASGHTHLPKLLSTLDAPKLSRPNVRNWIPLVRNSIPVPDKSSDQLDEMLKLMDGSDASNKRRTKETDNQTNQKDSDDTRPKKKYKVDLNKEIESLTNPAVEQVKGNVTPENSATSHETEASSGQDAERKHSKEKNEVESHPEPKEKQTAKKSSTKDSEEEKDDESEAASQSENTDEDSHTEESDDSKHRRARHKKKRKRSRSSSSDSDYSRHRRKKRKRSHRRHRKRNKRSRRRRDSTSSLSDKSKESEEEKDEEGEEEEEDDEDEDVDDEQEEEDDDKNEGNDNKSKEDSESDDKNDSSDEVNLRKKSKRHRKKHRHYRKMKHRKNRHRGKRKRKRSKSYSRSRSSSGSRESNRSRSRSTSRHRKKKGRSRHKSRNVSDSEEKDSDQERSRSRSSSRNSSKARKSRENREKDSSSSKHKDSSKSKDERLEQEEGRRGSNRKSRDRSSSKSRQQTTREEKQNGTQEELSVPMPIDPSKIKVEKNDCDALIPDLSKVKVEKEDSEKPSTQVSTSVNTKDSNKSHDGKGKGQGESGPGKASEKVSERRRSSAEEKKRRISRDRKDSSESTPDKGIQRRQSSESKTSNAEGSQQRKKTEERRQSIDKNKMTPPISSQPSEMSMFDLVLASTKKPKPKALTEISIFDSTSNNNNNTSDRDDDSDAKSVQADVKKSKDVSQKVAGDRSSSSHNLEHKSSSDKTHKTSKSAATDSHHKHDKSDKSLHSSSKSKSSSSSSHHHSSSSTHKRTNSTSSKGGSSKHHSTSTTTTTTTTTTTPSSSFSSSKHSENKSSKSKKVSESGSSSRGEKDSRHSSSSSRKHSGSSSSSKHQEGTSSSSSSRRRSSSNSSKHKEDKSTTSGPAKTSKGGEAAKKRKVSLDDESSGGISDDGNFSLGGDSPLPDLSVLDEIPQHDWEQMLSGSNTKEQELLSESDNEVDYDDPGVIEECMKLYEEFQPGSNPLENQVLPKKIKAPTEESSEPTSALSKQRVARSSSTGNLMARKPSSSRHQRNNPMQRMVERYQKLKEELKLKEQQLHHLKGSSSAVSSSSSSRTSIAAASSSTHTPHSTSGSTKKRIAHVPNVSSLLSAQGKLSNHTSSRKKISPQVAKASGVIPETTAHTVAKGGKRVAHLPKPGALARPIIQPELGSLVPQNIRQRYLNALIEECKKFSTEREAFNIAAAEERVCYQRAPSRMVYLNLVVNAVKRLRTQQQAGEQAQELLDGDPQLAEKMCIEEPSSSSSKPASQPSPSSSPSSSRQHPINPNHVQLSHTSVLSSGGIRGSWSIEKSKKTHSSSDEALKGVTFYKHLQKYVMTEEQLADNGYPLPDPEEKGRAIVKQIDTRKKISPSALERYCDRCSVLYNVDKWGFPKTTAPCVYHWGRAYKKRKYGTFETTYSCCGGEQGSGGCSQATTHVSQNYNPKNLTGYVRTFSKDMSSSNKEVYALDCEMCYTTNGNELTRVTVIGCDGNVVYEQLVKPSNPILDYNTRFSGITESDMEEVELTLQQVQGALLARFSDKTILIGHSLESDLHALKMIHNTVVDTSVVFPHKMGAPYKRALKNLAAEFLKRIIQDDVGGHDSAEDAVACLHLMHWKVKEDLKGFSK